MDAIVHLAAAGSVVDSVADPVANFEANARGTFSVLTAARAAEVGRLVFSSTGGALIGNATPPVNEQSLPKPISPYGASKLAAEAYCHAFAKSYGITDDRAAVRQCLRAVQRAQEGRHHGVLPRRCTRADRSRSSATARPRATSCTSTTSAAASTSA